MRDNYEILTMSGQEAFNEVIDLILGDDYYIVDPITNAQANPIILKDIKNKYNKIVSSFRITAQLAVFFGVLVIVLLLYILNTK